MTRVAIVGGSGLIGRALTQSLVADGHSVVVLSRNAGKAARRASPGVEVKNWSADDVNGLAANLGGVDAVVSLGGTPIGPWPWTGRRKASILSSRVIAAGAILAAITRLEPDRRPRVFVVVTGVDAYPETEGSADPAPTTEATPIGGGFLADVTSAVEGEARPAEGLGVRVVYMRQGQVLARQAILMRILALPVRLFAGGRLGSGAQWLSWIHIDDAVGLYRVAMADGGPSGVLNVVSPGACRQVAFVRAVARVLHRPARVRVPAWLLRFALGEQSTLLLGSQRVAPTRALELGYAFRYPTIEAAMETVLG